MDAERKPGVDSKELLGKELSDGSGLKSSKRKSNPEIRSAAWLIVAAAALRTAFGILMAIVINAGPNLSSAFHIIGGMFATVYPDADAKHALAGVSTYPIAPGEGVVFDAIMSQPGKYPIVNHNMRDMMIGAAGELHVSR